MNADGSNQNQTQIPNETQTCEKEIKCSEFGPESMESAWISIKRCNRSN